MNLRRNLLRKIGLIAVLLLVSGLIRTSWQHSLLDRMRDLDRWYQKLQW